MLDGEAVDFNQTPSDLDLEDNDQIDCFLQQVGGASDDEDSWRLMQDLRCLVNDLWRLAHDLWCLVHNSWHLVHDL